MAFGLECYVRVRALGLGCIWPLGAIVERSWGVLDHLRSHLEASQVILGHLGTHLGLSEAPLEPYWANIGRSGRSRTTPLPH